MSSVEVTISGVLYDKTTRTGRPVTLIGEAIITGLGVGGGPMPPGQGGGGDGGGGEGIWGPTDPRPGYGDPGIPGNTPGRPPGIWGGPIDPYPGHPLPQPPGGGGGGSGGGGPGGGGGGITPPLPPDMEQPQPGDPTQPYPPPQGRPGWPVQPIQPPPYIVVNYPGVGPVIVAPPQQTEQQQ